MNYQLLLENLTNPALLFFVLGIIAVRLKSDLAIPSNSAKFISLYLLFSIGIIGTGLIAIPVLSGSLSYIFSETFGWKQGLDKKFHEARGFYVIIAISLLLGLALNYVGISPMAALLYTAILYGVTAPVLIAIILHICNNKKIMGDHVNSRTLNLLGFFALTIMTAAAAVLLYLLCMPG